MDELTTGPRYLVAFDLDGTVLSPGADALTPRMEAALNRAKGLGCAVTVATGRTERIIPPAILNAPAVDYLITSNGARLTRRLDGKCLFEQELPGEIAMELVLFQRPLGAAFNLFFHEGAVREELCDTYMSRFFPGMGRRQLSAEYVTRVDAHLASGARGLEKLGCFYPNYESAVAVLPALEARTDIEAVLSMGNELEVTAPGVNKGAALGVLARELKLSAAQVLAFGDSGNDMSMRESAGTLVAMGNASPELKAVADAVTDNVEEDGAAAYLEHWLNAIEERA